MKTTYTLSLHPTPSTLPSRFHHLLHANPDPLLGEPDGGPYMVKLGFQHRLKAFAFEAGPGAVAVEITNDLGSGFGIGDPKLAFFMHGGENVLHNRTQLVLVNGKHQGKVDLAGFQQRRNAFEKETLANCFSIEEGKPWTSKFFSSLS